MSQELQQMLNTYFGIVRQVSRLLDFAEEDVTLQEIRIIEFVSEAREISMGTLSEKFPLPASTATRYVDRLVRRGYLDRKRPKNDRRRVLLKISDKGFKLLARRNEVRNKFFLRMFSKLTAEEVDYLSRIFQKLIVDPNFVT
ncbi:MAG: MarR family winged helix-turn-helix transcriptional regulator [Candidatus Thorarchaeota archaeon]